MAKPESSNGQLASRACSPEGPSNNKLETKRTAGLKKNEVYIGNLPSDITEDQIMQLFAAFEPVTVRRIVSGLKCFAFVDVGNPQNMTLAVSHINNTIYCGRRLIVRDLVISRSCERPLELLDQELLPLEKVDNDSGKAARAVPCPGRSRDRSEPVYAVPLEMRSLLQVEVLSSCFKTTEWIVESASVRGEVGLMVMETFPQMPFFWAMNLTPETYMKMCQLFTALSVVTQDQPFLMKAEVQRGRRCMAEYPGESGDWNRCWIVDVVEDKAILLYVDSGNTACVPAAAVKSLDKDEFWNVPPLVQPFVLHQGKSADGLSSAEG
ncbi:tudor domain-containing protein 10-like [Leucoraja erinacea]|uniref:tudor domain-containing protein 10-like n=1 Tax=Leucoraja erinaceus TaxID=7782 RepID=UPI00245624C8|nr:tudor domain-containing protein 10-like [Leucoraja erinacea]